jgi:hypothetical protein
MWTFLHSKSLAVKKNVKRAHAKDKNYTVWVIKR